jgi:nitrogen fixation protein NifZ
MSCLINTQEYFMSISRLNPGDIVFAAKEIVNDGSLPGMDQHALIAKSGGRGVVINVGHVEEQPDMELFLVRFENDDAELGPPVGCWPEELREAGEDEVASCASRSATATGTQPGE